MTKEDNPTQELGANKIPVFLAWSGSASQKTALVLYEHLPLIINAIEPYMSEEELDKGSRWSSEITGQLQLTQFGILCITPENIDSRWIHFEAGALSKVVTDSHVCPFLVGIKKSKLKDPLNMFQATICERGDFYKLIATLNETCGDSKLKDEQLKKTFDAFWPKIEKVIKSVEEDLTKTEVKNDTTKPSSPEESPSFNGELIEELIVRSREQSRQLINISTTLIKENRGAGSFRSLSDIMALEHEVGHHEDIFKNQISILIEELNQMLRPQENCVIHFDYNPEAKHIIVSLKDSLSQRHINLTKLKKIAYRRGITLEIEAPSKEDDNLRHY